MRTSRAYETKQAKPAGIREHQGSCINSKAMPRFFLYSTVTDLARFLGLSTSQPRAKAIA